MKKFIQVAMFAAIALVGVGASNAQSFNWVVDEIDVYDMQVLRIGSQRMTVQIDGVGRRSFRVPSDFRFYIDGEPTRLRELQPRQRLTAYVTRNARGEIQLVDAGPVQATPPARPVSTPVVAVPAPLPEEMTTLPKTGSVFPATLGIALGAGVLALAVRRRRFAQL